MSNPYATAGVLSRLFFLTVLGFCVVILAGPVLALLSVLLSFLLVGFAFAFVGFLVWAVVQVVVGGKQAAWRNIQDLGQAFRNTLSQFGRFALQTLRFPAGVGRAVSTGASRLGRMLWAISRTIIRAAGEVGVMTATGLLVGGGAELIFGPKKPDHGLPVPLNILLGAALGCLVGLVMFVIEAKTRRRQSMIGLD